MVLRPAPDAGGHARPRDSDRVPPGSLQGHPLFDWPDRDVGEYLKAHDLPYHPLWDQGYLSIGDWHTTRSLAEAGASTACGFSVSSGSADCTRPEGSRRLLDRESASEQQPLADDGQRNGDKPRVTACGDRIETRDRDQHTRDRAEQQVAKYGQVDVTEQAVAGAGNDRDRQCVCDVGCDQRLPASLSG